jgi:hypothetical protein
MDSFWVKKAVKIEILSMLNVGGPSKIALTRFCTFLGLSAKLSLETFVKCSKIL